MHHQLTAAGSLPAKMKQLPSSIDGAVLFQFFLHSESVVLLKIHFINLNFIEGIKLDEISSALSADETGKLAARTLAEVEMKMHFYAFEGNSSVHKTLKTADQRQAKNRGDLNENVFRFLFLTSGLVKVKANDIMTGTSLIKFVTDNDKMKMTFETI